jgi:hypothetical protein
VIDSSFQSPHLVMSRGFHRHPDGAIQPHAAGSRRWMVTAWREISHAPSVLV